MLTLSNTPCASVLKEQQNFGNVCGHSVVVKNIGSEVRLTLIQSQALPYTSCITLGKSYDLSEFPHLLKQRPNYLIGVL